MTAVQDDVRAELLAIVYFNERGELWHDEGRGNAEQFSLIGERLRVVASRGGDDATLLLLGRKLRERIARPAFLKTCRALQTLELAEDFHAGDVAQRDRMRSG
jgi:hypothetical protein